MFDHIKLGAQFLIVAATVAGKLALNYAEITAGLYYLSNSWVTQKSFPSISTLKKSRSLRTLYFLNIDTAFSGVTISCLISFYGDYPAI